MKKSKLLSMTLLPILAGVAASLTVSCVKKGRYDLNDDGKLSILSGFSSTNNQGKALSAMVALYNKYVDEFNKSPEVVSGAKDKMLQMEILINTSGYDGSKISADLNARNASSGYNIVINYPAIASTIVQYRMTLAIPDEVYNSLGLADAFAHSNERIALNDKNEKWVAPISRSTEMMALNQILLGKFLHEIMTEYGATYEESKPHVLIDKYIKAYTDSKKVSSDDTPTDATQADKIWAPSKTTNEGVKNKVKEDVKQFKLSDEIFSNYKQLIQLSILFKKMYNNSNQTYVLGLDSFPNAVNSIVGSLTNDNPEKHYISKNPEEKVTGGYDYKKFWNDKNSKEYKVFKEAVDILLDGIKTGAIWVGGAGAYGSTDLTLHKLAISMGSTAGWSHTFVEDSDKTYYVETNDLVADNTSVINAATYTAPTDSNKIIDGIGKHNNNFFYSTYTGEKGKYDYQLKTAKDDKKLKDFLTAHAGQKIAVSTSKIFKEENGKLYAVSQNNPDIKKEVTGVTFNKDSVASNYSPITVLLASDLTEAGKHETLQQKEADWLPIPLKATGASEESNVIFTQGPSFVLMHANDREDKAIMEFIKWFYTHKYKTHSFEGKTYTNKTPIDMFNLFGSYVSPTSSFFAQTEEDIKALKLNEAQKIAFDGFKKAVTDPEHYKSVEDIASTKSDPLRQALTSTAKALASIAQTNPKEATFDKFIERFKPIFN